MWTSMVTAGAVGPCPSNWPVQMVPLNDRPCWAHWPVNGGPGGLMSWLISTFPAVKLSTAATHVGVPLSRRWIIQLPVSW
jgi:hypothetical protein